MVRWNGHQIIGGLFIRKTLATAMCQMCQAMGDASEGGMWICIVFFFKIQLESESTLEFSAEKFSFFVGKNARPNVLGPRILGYDMNPVVLFGGPRAAALEMELNLVRSRFARETMMSWNSERRFPGERLWHNWIPFLTYGKAGGKFHLPDLEGYGGQRFFLHRKAWDWNFHCLQVGASTVGEVNPKKSLRRQAADKTAQEAQLKQFEP